MRQISELLRAIFIVALAMIVVNCGGGGGGSTNNSTNVDGKLQGNWYFNSGSQTYSFSSIQIVSANDGKPEGQFKTTDNNGIANNYVYNVDTTGTAIMLFNDLGNGTVQLVRTYSFEASPSMLQLKCWNKIAYYCKGAPNNCTPPGAIASYEVTYYGNNSTSGSVPVDSTNYTQGQTVTVLGNTGNLVKANYSFASWNTQADGLGTTYTQGQTFAMGTANVILYAQWTATDTSKNLSVTKTGFGSGTITSSPAGISCGLTCSSALISGATATLTVSADKYSAFTNWTGCDSASGPQCTVTMSADKAVAANFIQLTVDQQNNSNWTGGASNIGSYNNVRQTFIPSLPRLYAVEVGLMTGNSGRGDDQVTLTIIDSNEQAIATKTETIAEGFNGFYYFKIADNGINVIPGQTYTLQLADTNKIVFFWRYTNNSYSGGQAYFYGSPFNNNDFFFNTYGTY